MTLDAAPPLLTCSDVQVTYRNGGRGLRGVSLVVKGGEHIAIIGESGCGKSTLVRAILGLLPAGTTISGSIRLDDGGEIAGAAERQLRDMRGRLVGYVPQNPAGSFDPLRSIGSQLAEAWQCHGHRVDRAFLVGLLEQMGVEAARELVGRRPPAWSGGMLQRAAIVAATALRPRLVLADEPTSALDRPLARQMLATLAASCDASIVVTHDVDLIEGIAHRVIVMYAGTIVEDTPAAMFFRGPRHPYARALLEALPRPGCLPRELPGDPPASTEAIPGCPFAPRCTLRQPICDRPPPLVEGVACHVTAGGV